MKTFLKTTTLALSILATQSAFAQTGSEVIVWEIKGLKPTEAVPWEGNTDAPITRTPLQVGTRYEGTHIAGAFLPSYVVLRYDISDILTGEMLDAYWSTKKEYTVRVLINGRVGGPAGMTLKPGEFRSEFYWTYKGDCEWHEDNDPRWLTSQNVHGYFKQDVTNPAWTPFSIFNDSKLRVFDETMNCNDPGGNTNGMRFYGYLRAPSVEVHDLSIQIFEKN